MKVGKTVLNYTNGKGVKVIKCIIFNDNGKFVGISKCNPTDKYNFEYGRKLAELRAEIKALKADSRYLDKVADAHQAIADKHIYRAIDCRLKIEEVEIEIDELLQENHR